MLHPVNGYIVLEPYKETARASGILIPETTREKPMRGTIHAAPKDSGWGVGTEVLYSKYGAIDIRYEDRELIIVRERDIIAAIDDAV